MAFEIKVTIGFDDSSRRLLSFLQSVTDAVGENVERKLDVMQTSINVLETKMERIMVTLDQLVQEVADETTLVDSLSTFVQGLRDQIAALPGLSQAQQSQIDQVFASVGANKDKIAAAMTANTPVANAANPVPPQV